jgi:hypothetical protein
MVRTKAKKPGFSEKSWMIPGDIDAETWVKALRASRNDGFISRT